jgi:hypothetical protein
MGRNERSRTTTSTWPSQRVSRGMGTVALEGKPKRSQKTNPPSPMRLQQRKTKTGPAAPVSQSAKASTCLKQRMTRPEQDRNSGAMAGGAAAKDRVGPLLCRHEGSAEGVYSNDLAYRTERRR